ncbi:sulfatase-like hydrolase/transferase [Aliifodinibius sp. S!AR15-10]|uniref:sulfatase-like hydrolase/transferase n=1 Tax=Aliifodinibius sp. S!AR15-10 TaxID=2950437 RepID=UPI00285ABE05|nr:sulfatase-like hydrolase/transferase [Aliifodinibius sp. S!AR15-10]MDR8393275.1 sulfatase-like hydrolase/transferase [Aliifodinibius sp. S!AR15-10]
MMKMRIGIILLITVVMLGCGQQEETSEPPNILWITSEDNSPYLGAYGDTLADTPNLDRLAEQGTVYENAFATTPVCAPSRFTLITGLYANVMGTENMRSTFPIPEQIQFFPKYLREVGYHTTNNVKKDYNTVDQPEAWVESSDSATYKTRDPGQPFFHVRNFTTTHESRLHDPIDTLIHDPDQMPIPPYHPDTEAIKTDWAHYYDQITKMDAQVGEVLDELEASGEAENTIVFYYSDHGGVLPRSKRFMFESGLRVPLIVYFPPKYQHLAPDQDRTDRLVSFVDFPKTVLSLAGIEPPEYMHGQAFLGEYEDEPREYVQTYRGRMDERFDLVRAIRDKEFLYVRNFMPHRIYGQHLAYLWRAPSMQSWHEQYLQGNLNETQRRFFDTKPAEELYNVDSDPHSVNNLAGDPEYQEILERMRKATSDWMHQSTDLGFIPEETIDSLRGDQPLYNVVREQSLPIGEIIETAQLATRNASANLDTLAGRLDHEDGAVRFWAATGFSVADEKPAEMGEKLLNYTDDSSPAVRIAVAEALYRYGNESEALQILEQSLDLEHPFAKLRSLNTIKALDIDNLPTHISEKIKTMQETHDDQWGTDYYIRRAATSIVGE